MNQSETALPGKALLAEAKRQITRGNYHKGSGLVWQAAMAALSAGELLWSTACHGFAAERHPDTPHRQPRTRRELLHVIDHLHVGGKCNTICATACAQPSEDCTTTLTPAG